MECPICMKKYKCNKFAYERHMKDHKALEDIDKNNFFYGLRKLELKIDKEREKQIEREKRAKEKKGKKKSRK